MMSEHEQSSQVGGSDAAKHSGARAVEHFAAMNAELIRTAAALSTVATAADTLGEAQHAATLRERLEHLASGAFVVAIVGEFKRGKSTLANALLGAEVMPSDVLPATAAVNRVVFGRVPAATLRFHDGREETISIDQLSSYVSKLDDASAARAASLQEAVVAFPTHLCRHNVELLDTPGLGDEAAMTERTVRAIARADAAVMVTSALAPFAQSEAEILEELIQYVDPSRLFFVVGQIDLLAARDVERVVAAVERRLRAALPASAPPPRVLPVSAREALHGKLERDHARLAASRFEAFEQAIEQFLVRDRGVAIVQAANEVLAAVSARLVAAARGKLAEIEREESAADESVRARERALSELGSEALALTHSFGARADAAREEGARVFVGIADPLCNTAKYALGQLVFTEAHVTNSAGRHEAVEQQVAPQLRTLLEHAAERGRDVLVSWTRVELSKLAVLGGRLEELLAADRDKPESAASASPASQAEALLHDLVGDCGALRATAQEFKLSYVPASFMGSVNSLAGDIAGNTVVNSMWRKLQGKAGERLAEERSAMMSERLKQDYVEHFEVAIRAETQRVDLVARYEQTWRQLAEKVALKVHGDTELVRKVCEIRPWELRVARHKARAEREREIERIHGALAAAEAATHSAQERVSSLKGYLSAAPTGAARKEEREHD